MRRRDVVVIIISVIIVVIAGGLLYRYLAPPTKDSTIKVEIPHPVDPTFNQEQLNVLKNDVVDFSQDINPDEGQQQPSQPSDSNQSSAKPSLRGAESSQSTGR